jgi:hypothetical protein
MLENANLHWKKSYLMFKDWEKIQNPLKMITIWTFENKVQINALKVDMHHLVKDSWIISS